MIDRRTTPRANKGRIRWVRPFVVWGLLAFAGGLAAAPHLPREVMHFLERRMDCDHWTGEEPYDADRRREIEAAISDLRCVTIERDELRLRKRFARRPEVLRALDREDQ